MSAQVKAIDRSKDHAAQILLMEDEIVVAEGLQMILSEEGHQVEIANTGTRALEQLHHKPYDLLVADLRLPDINGMDVIKQIRADGSDTGIIVITGYSTVDTAVDAMRIGANDYLAKPFTEDQIREAVDKVLGNRVVPAKRAATPAEQQAQALIEKREVMRVLNRTSEDPEFWTALMEQGGNVLGDYQLSSAAKAAIASGDLRWINANIGELTQKQLMFIYKRLEREAW